MEEERSSGHLKSGRKASAKYEPSWLGKGVSPYQTRLHTFSHQFNLFRLYSVEAIWQTVEALWRTLICAQVETGIPYVAGSLSNVSYSTNLAKLPTIRY